MKSSEENKEKRENEKFLRDRPDPQGRAASVQQTLPNTKPVHSDPDKERYGETPPAPEARPKRAGPGPSE
jgi:hypothetical protein